MTADRTFVTPAIELVYTKFVFEKGCPPKIDPPKYSYSVGGIVDKADWEADPKGPELVDYIKKRARQLFGEDCLKKGFRLNGIIPGERKSDEWAGKICLTAKDNKNAPVVFKADGEQITEDYEGQHVYPGAKAQLVVLPFFYNKGTGPAGACVLYIRAIQLLEGGERRSLAPPSPDKMRALLAANKPVALTAAAAPALNEPEPAPAPPPVSRDDFEDEPW